MMLVKGTCEQSASMPGMQARSIAGKSALMRCPEMGRLAFTSGSMAPKFIACSECIPTPFPQEETQTA